MYIPPPPPPVPGTPDFVAAQPNYTVLIIVGLAVALLGAWLYDE